MVDEVFDSHLHIVDPRFPLTANQGFVPEPFTVADYRAAVADLDVRGGAVVSGSFQAFDQRYLLDALARLGPGFVGVTQLPATVADAELVALAAAGVRAVRFNLHRGGSAGVEHLEELAQRVDRLVGWHTEIHVDGRHLAELEPRLARVPRLSIDHLGLCREGFAALLRLVERGARVKATGFGRVDLDVPVSLRAIAAVNPNALLFGTDLPSTRAPRPFAPSDLDVVLDALDPDDARRAVSQNARAWYRLDPQEP